MHLLSGLWERECKVKIGAHMTDDACVEYNQFYNNIHIYETEVAFYCRNATYFSEIANIINNSQIHQV